MGGYKVNKIERTGKHKSVMIMGEENKICRQKKIKHGSYSNVKW